MICKVKTFFPFFIFLLMLLSCHDDDNDVIDKANSSSGFTISFNDIKGNEFTPFLIDNGVIHIFIPKDVNLSALTPNFPQNKDIFMGSNGYQIMKSQALDFSDFANPVKIKQISLDGSEKKWQVNVYDIPVLLINTPNSQAINSKTERVEGCELKLIENDIGFVFERSENMKQSVVLPPHE